MAWDVSKLATETNYNFSKAIPKTARTWVRIDTVRPNAHSMMEAALSDATLEYNAGVVQQRHHVHWELIKETACWLTLIETNFEFEGNPLFPKRRQRYIEVDKADFHYAWSKLLPLDLTDEWMAAVLEANDVWFEMLGLWVPIAWLRKWMPEKLEEVPAEADEEPKVKLKEQESVGEGSGE